MLGALLQLSVTQNGEQGPSCSLPTSKWQAKEGRDAECLSSALASGAHQSWCARAAPGLYIYTLPYSVPLEEASRHTNQL